MGTPRPYLVRMFNEGNPYYHVCEFIMWSSNKDMAMGDGKAVFSRRDFCPLQPTQFLTVAEATMEDQKRCRETFHGYRKVFSKAKPVERF